MAALSPLNPRLALPFPPQLRDSLAYPETPWLMSADLSTRVRQQPFDTHRRVQRCVLLKTDPEYDFILRYFLHDKPHGYSIRKIECIHNPTLQQAFEAELHNMEIEARKFLPDWQNAPNSEERKWVIKRWRKLTNPFFPLKVRNAEQKMVHLFSARVVAGWHGSSAAKCHSVATSGFTYFGKHHFFNPAARAGPLGSTDEGFFGSGAYFTDSVRYSKMYSPEGDLIFAWVGMREPYPVVSDVHESSQCTDMKILSGQGAYQSYNAHFIPVIAPSSAGSQSAIYYPCYQDQTPAWDEIVVFQKSQVLPRFHVYLTVDSPAAPLSLVINDFASCYAACQAGDSEQVKSWISNYPSCLAEKGDMGETLLDAAVIGNHFELCEWLYEKRPALLKNCRHDQSTLLHVAAAAGHRRLASWIYEQDASQIDKKNDKGLTPLQLAALYEHIPLLVLFASVIQADSAFILWVVQQSCSSALAHLIEQGASVNSANRVKQTLLHLAAQAGQIENVVYLLLEQKANINALDLSRRTPLFLAASKGHLAIVQLLLEKGAQVDLMTVEGETVMHAAAFYGNIPLLELLLPYARHLIQAKDQDGKTPLHKAVWGDPKPAVVEWLLAHQANPKEVNLYGFTALHWAAKHGHLESAKHLIKGGALANVTNVNNDTPINLARNWGQDRLFHYLTNPALEIEDSGNEKEELEKKYYERFQQACQGDKYLEQAHCLEKLSDLFADRQDEVKAAHFLNQALAICQRYDLDASYQDFLFAKLERVEGLFLEGQGIKTGAPHRGYIRRYRTQLKEHRAHIHSLISANTPSQEILAASAAFFKQLSLDMTNDCLALLGVPPTPIALLGLGAMSRQEMTPYSDLKFAIVIKDNHPKNRAYFRILSRLLQLRIINLGKTPFPLLSGDHMSPPIAEKMNFVTQGVSLNQTGFSPLGKEGVYELIGDPESLALMQTPDWLQKNPQEYSSIHTLTESTFIAGTERRLAALYEQCVQKILNRKETLGIFGKAWRIERAERLLAQHLQDRKTWLEEQHLYSKPFDVKKDLYQPLQTILQVLRLYYDLENKNSSETIGELERKGVLSRQGAQHLQDILAQIQKWRIEAYQFYQARHGLIDQVKKEEEKDPQKYAVLSADFLKVYRALIQLHEKAHAFLRGNVKSFLTLTR